MKTIILIKGAKRAGKDTTASILVEELKGYDVSRMSFAEPMKEIMADTFGVSLGTIETAKNEPNNFEVVMRQLNLECTWNRFKTDMRQILQRFGTEAMKKQFGADVWSELLYNKLTSDITIVSDWRFKSELKYLKAQDNITVVTIAVIREGQINLDTHISERDLDDVLTNFTIINKQGNYQDLREQVRHILQYIPRQTKIKYDKEIE